MFILYWSLIRLKNIKSGNVVAIVNEKSKLSYALMIALLCEGITYVNIDVETPVKRFESILKICSPKFIFFDKHIENLIEYTKKVNIDFFCNGHKLPVSKNIDYVDFSKKMNN